MTTVSDFEFSPTNFYFGGQGPISVARENDLPNGIGISVNKENTQSNASSDQFRYWNIHTKNVIYNFNTNMLSSFRNDTITAHMRHSGIYGQTNVRKGGSGTIPVRNTVQLFFLSTNYHLLTNLQIAINAYGISTPIVNTADKVITENAIDMFGFALYPGGKIRFLKGVYTMSDLLNSSEQVDIHGSTQNEFTLKYDGLTLKYYNGGADTAEIHKVTIQNKPFRMHIVNLNTATACSEVYCKYKSGINIFHPFVNSTITNLLGLLSNMMYGKSNANANAITDGSENIPIFYIPNNNS
jgi:hypothetical protein